MNGAAKVAGLSITALLCFFGESATAAEPAPVWTGYYAGINGGYGWSKEKAFMHETSSLGLFYFPANVKATSTPAYNISGAFVGGQIGYNYQFAPKWLIGLEVDVQTSRIGGSGSSPLKTSFNQLHLPDFRASADSELHWFATARARAGFLASDILMLFATGGLAFGEIKRNGSIFDTFAGTLTAASAGQTQVLNCIGLADCFRGSDSDRGIGWTVGAGAEVAIWSNVSLKAEFLHIEFNGKHSTLQATQAPFQLHFDADFGRTRYDIFRLGLNYRFTTSQPLR